MANGVLFERWVIEDFCERFPCANIPETVESIWFGFETNGDLVEIEAKDEAGKLMDSSEFDGPGLLALSDTARDLWCQIN